MGRHKAIESPEKLWELDLPKNKSGHYIIVPKKKNYSGINISNKNKFPDGFIYFIRCQNTTFYKIGVSKKPKRRICDIDSYLPYDLEILSIHYFKNVYDVEKEVSKILEKNKIRREWYELSIEQAKDIMIFLHNKNVEKDASNENI
jgi:hypothetical protein